MAKMHSLKSIDDNLCQKSHFWGVKKIDLFFHSECTFRFYSAHDLWTSNGAHLVFLQDQATVFTSDEEEPRRLNNDTDVTMLESTRAQAEDELSNENFESYKEDYPDW